MKKSKLDFEYADKKESYRTEFVEEVLNSRQQAKTEKVKRVKKKELKSLLDL